jgi:hypothetical protein
MRKYNGYGEYCSKDAHNFYDVAMPTSPGSSGRYEMPCLGCFFVSRRLNQDCRINPSFEPLHRLARETCVEGLSHAVLPWLAWTD